MMRDMIAEVGDDCVRDVGRIWGIPGKNENGERLVDVSAYRGGVPSEHFLSPEECPSMHMKEGGRL